MTVQQMLVNKIVPRGDWGHLRTLTLTSDDLESHIVVNVSSTLTSTTIWIVAALCFIVDVRTDVRTYGRMDIFTRFIRSSLKRWPKNGEPVAVHETVHFHFLLQSLSVTSTSSVACSYAMSMICCQSTHLLAFSRLSGYQCYRLYISINPLSQVVHGHCQGLFQSLGGQRNAPIAQSDAAWNLSMPRNQRNSAISL